MATGNAIQWFLNSTGGAALNSTTALTTQTYYAEQTDPATLCKSTTRTSVNVTGNCLASAVVARWEGELDDEKMNTPFKPVS